MTRRNERQSSPDKANAAQQVLESRVGPQSVEGQPAEHPRIEALRVSLFQPGHRLILLVKTHIDQGDLGSI